MNRILMHKFQNQWTKRIGSEIFVHIENVIDMHIRVLTYAYLLNYYLFKSVNYILCTMCMHYCNLCANVFLFWWFFCSFFSCMTSSTYSL